MAGDLVVEELSKLKLPLCLGDALTLCPSTQRDFVHQYVIRPTLMHVRKAGCIGFVKDTERAKTLKKKTRLRLGRSFPFVTRFSLGVLRTAFTNLAAFLEKLDIHMLEYGPIPQRG